MHEDENPTESLEDEGMPGELFEEPPGIDIETESEGMMAPREHSLATGTDPAYPTTAEENRRPESVAERAAREQPDFDELEEEDPDDFVGKAAPRLVEPDANDAGDDEEDEAIGELAEGDDLEGEGPEEQAMHLTTADDLDDLDPEVEREQYLEGR